MPGPVNEPSPQRRRRWAQNVSRFERFLAYYAPEVPREDRPPVDLAIGLRWERIGATVRAIVTLGFAVYWFVVAVPVLATTIAGVIVAVIGVWEAKHVIVLTRRIKRVRGPSGPPSRELSVLDEQLVEHRAEAAREDRGPA
jgi:hypothetical protein